VLFFGSHVLDVLSARGCSERTVAGSLLLDVVRVRGMDHSMLCGRSPHRFNAASARRFRIGGTSRNFSPEQPFSLRSGAAAHHSRRVPMLGWALTFLVVALIAAVLGFGGIAGLSIEIAKITFFVAVVLFLISAIVGLVRGRSSTVP